MFFSGSIDTSNNLILEETEVIAFLHVDFSTKSNFIELTISGNVLTLSPEHLISIVTRLGSKFVSADSVKPGMFVHLGSSQHGLVSNVSITEKTGFIAPLTNSGSLIVNNVLVSCYVYHPMYSHYVSHLALLPYRIGKKLSNFLPFEVKSVNTKRLEDGEMNWYANALYNVFF